MPIRGITLLARHSTDAGGGAHVPALRGAYGLMAYTHPTRVARMMSLG